MGANYIFLISLYVYRYINIPDWRSVGNCYDLHSVWICQRKWRLFTQGTAFSSCRCECLVYDRELDFHSFLLCRPHQRAMRTHPSKKILAVKAKRRKNSWQKPRSVKCTIEWTTKGRCHVDGTGWMWSNTWVRLVANKTHSRDMWMWHVCLGDWMENLYI